ncbi:hypothetical protein SAMN06264364_101305 [Quadrisphaera granulorum]|uniref:DUF2256 and DUF3253 domain-containing protein n=1 Tax=Quadrisphaera granulorum TaxID=317664 RepID=A0A316AG49_9ACTN|nr:hypothetical protein BXY45_101305 [Quadrisphaera granulorum]SZE94963.1 hypothetical protein SAMN06264364_101305 [Quadrisphaera granulorum]
MELPTKPCAVCGRTITWRRKWERDWDGVRYCSDACRRRARSETGRDVDAALEASLERLLDARPSSSSVCPSEAARVVAGELGMLGDDGEGWRDLMEPVRAAARRLVVAGRAQITQRGVVVDPDTAKGPIRVRRPR